MSWFTGFKCLMPEPKKWPFASVEWWLPHLLTCSFSFPFYFTPKEKKWKKRRNETIARLAMFTSSNYDFLDNNLYMSTSCLLRQNHIKHHLQTSKVFKPHGQTPWFLLPNKKPTHHPLNDPNLPEHLPKFQGHRSRASTKHRCIERDLKDRDESPSSLENESKIKKTPQSSAFSRHTHTMDWVTWMICMCQAALAEHTSEIDKPPRNSEALRLSLA